MQPSPGNAILTAEGLKAWPLQGWQLTASSFLPQRRTIDLFGVSNRKAYETLYHTQPWVHAAVNKISRGIARLPLHTLRDMPSGIPTDENDSDLAALFRAPFPRGSEFTLKEHTIGSLALYGHALIVPDFGEAVPWSRPPVALWPIPWRFVGVLAGEDEPIGAFVIQIGTVRRILFPDDVIHLEWWSPEGFIGVSPLEPLRTTLQLEDSMQRYTISSFSNGARPSGAIQSDSPINKRDRDELKAEIEATHGGVDNAFRIALLTHGLKWQPFSHTAVESEVISQRKLNREEVCAVYDLPPSMLQITERATHNNAQEAHRMLYMDSYAPWYTVWEQGMEVQFIRKFARWDGLSVRFHVDDVLRGDEDQRSISNQRRFQSAQVTPNEIRASEGQEPVPGSTRPDGTLDPEHPANQVYIPVNMLPASKVYESIDLQQQQPNEPGPGGEHTPTPEEQRSMIRKLESAGYRIELATNGHHDHPVPDLQS